VIDPVLVFSTLLGGSHVDGVTDLAVDAAGNAYITGSTNSFDFPTTAAGTVAGESDAFLTKIDPTGSKVLYSTLLGGRSYDDPSGIAVDGAGQVTVAGRTDSLDFPATAEVGTPGSFSRGFVTKLDASGSSMVFSTVVVDAWMNDVALGAAGVAYAVGAGLSNMPIAGGLDDTHNGGELDGFIAKFGSDGSLLYSTFLGGAAWDAADQIVVDAAGGVYVAGATSSLDFPTVAPFDPDFSGGQHDAFVAKLEPDGSALVYSTYLGSAGSDWASGIAVDGSGAAYVSGRAGRGGFPTTHHAFDVTYNGGPDYNNGEGDG
jgi:hypothetical protein